MGKPKDCAALECYRHVLGEFGNVTGFIEWRKVPRKWFADNFPDENKRLVHEIMVEHARSGGAIDQVVETRPEYVDWSFHYDLRLLILNRRVYIETVIERRDDLEDCTIWIVSMHDQ